MPRTADDFLADIAKNPDDDGVRAVFADWLLERGDPRGEFIALQLKAHRTDEDLSREALLFNRYVRSWLPHDVFHNLEYPTIVFEKGMLTAAHVAVRSRVSLNTSLSSPVWGTVRRLASAPPELVERCPALEELTGADELTVTMLAARGPLARLATLGVLGRAPRALAHAFDSDAFRAVRELRLGFPPPGALVDDREEDDVRRTLREMDPERLRAVFESALGKRLVRLVLQSGWIELAPWLEQLEAIDPPISEFQLTPPVFTPTRWWIRLSHRRRRVRVFPGTELDAAFSEAPVREILTTAPRGWFERLELPEHLGWASVRRLPCFERAEVVFAP